MIRIEVSQLPPKEFSGNSRSHWVDRYKAGNIYKAAVFYSCRDRLNRLGALPFDPAYTGIKKVRLNLTFVFAQNRLRDSDNLIARFKPGQDALVDSGIILADDQEHLVISDPVVLVDRKRAPLTIIELEAL